MPLPTANQLNLKNALWVDVNPLFTVNSLPDQLPDILSVQYASLYNLFNCPIGARARTFQPEFGSMWYQFLQEPLDSITAGKMQIAMIQAITRWEPRIKLNYSNTFIQPNMQLPGYTVRIAFTWNLSLVPQSMSFNIPVA